jgi:hypothetical protein
MRELTKVPLSGSTHGQAITVVSTDIATDGNTVHTAQASTTDGDCDEVVIEAYNSDTVERTLTLGWGGTATADLTTHKIPAGEYLHIRTGILRNGLVVKAAADAASKIFVHGYVVRAA